MVENSGHCLTAYWRGQCQWRLFVMPPHPFKDASACQVWSGGVIINYAKEGVRRGRGGVVCGGWFQFTQEFSRSDKIVQSPPSV